MDAAPVDRIRSTEVKYLMFAHELAPASVRLTELGWLQLHAVDVDPADVTSVLPYFRSPELIQQLPRPVGFPGSVAAYLDHVTFKKGSP